MTILLYCRDLTLSASLELAANNQKTGQETGARDAITVITALVNKGRRDRRPEGLIQGAGHV